MRILKRVRNPFLLAEMKRFCNIVAHRAVVLLVLFVLMSGMPAVAQVNDLPRTSPEAVGMKSAQVSAFFDSLLAYPKTEIHSVIVMRHGKVVGEMFPAPFRPEYKHTQFSCSKTFVAAAVGIAIDEKLLKLDDRLVTFFPKQLPRIVSWRLNSITVKDLLTMRSGFVVDTQIRNNSLDWIRSYLSHPMNADPGKLFQYDSMDTYLLSAIILKVTGKNVLDYLKQKMFRHMNIVDVKWEQSPEGINTGGWGLYIQPESLAKFGQLLLQRGRWYSRQLIPAHWVDAMMRQQVEVPKNDNYGYQMWLPSYPTAAYAAGAYGQYIMVVPKADVVVVINQCMMNKGSGEFRYIWKTLFAGMKEQPLAPSPDYQQLQQRTYSLPLIEGEFTSKVYVDYQGFTANLNKNPLGWSAITFLADDVIEITDTAGVKGQVRMGHQLWATSTVDFFPLNARYAVKNQFSTIPSHFKVGACYAWQDDELLIKLHFVDWMGSVLLRFHFDADIVTITAQENYQNTPITIIGTIDRQIETPSPASAVP